MSNSDYYENLIKDSTNAVALLKKQIDTTGSLMRDVIKNAPAEDREKVKAVEKLMQDAMAKAKNGDLDGVNELIKQFKDGGQGSK